MPPTLLQIILLALLQGITELLPVSSSAHVILAEKLMGLDPSSPEMTFLLVMLHTGTMFAVIVYFWKAWRKRYLTDPERLKSILSQLAVASACTFVLGFILKSVIENFFLGGGTHAEVEQLFSNLNLIGGALMVAGVLIMVSGHLTKNRLGGEDVTIKSAIWIGIVQALCLPFRGFSRSGATISTAILLGVGKYRSEEFSFAIALILTPPVALLELQRLLKVNSTAAQPLHMTTLLLPGMAGMIFSFLAGLLALGFLTRSLELGKWQHYGFYCLVFAAVVFVFASKGY